PLAILRIHAQNAQLAATPEQREEALEFLVSAPNLYIGFPPK
ncbi:MAG: hypothetical protein JWP42_4462, partial [Pseudomonas sp.]|nr:hypothetical protein [Pseudomonas sp.]